MMRLLSTAEVARILDLPGPRIRELVRGGLCRPARRGRAYAFSFQDVVVLRAAKGLLESRVPAARVRRALEQLSEQLPPDRPLSGVRVFADGNGGLMHRLMDEDEFEAARGRYAYDEALVARCYAAVDELVRMVEAREFPFDA